MEPVPHADMVVADVDDDHYESDDHNDEPDDNDDEPTTTTTTTTTTTSSTTTTTTSTSSSMPRPAPIPQAGAGTRLHAPGSRARARTCSGGTWPRARASSCDRARAGTRVGSCNRTGSRPAHGSCTRAGSCNRAGSCSCDRAPAPAIAPAPAPAIAPAPAPAIAPAPAPVVPAGTRDNAGVVAVIHVRSSRAARKAIAVGAVMLALVTACSRGDAAQTSRNQQPAGGAGSCCARASALRPSPTLPPVAAPPYDFGTVSTLIDDAIAANELPGAVVLIGHGGKVVFRQAYGERKLAGEPGLDGSPAPAEPMTEDTIFDVASLTKPLATAPAVMQLYEQGKVQFDDPVQKYLPDFNTANDPVRAEVTVRMLLTHTSGEPGDVELKDPWGLEQLDREEGFRRALTTPLESTSRRGLPLLRHQLHSAGRDGREAHGRGGRRLRAAERLWAAGHDRDALSARGQGVRAALDEGSGDRVGAATAGRAWPTVLQARGAPVCCRASRRLHGTTKTERTRARIPISITCCGAR